jgi:predicted SAM-dependent methyltransferase
MVSLNVGSGPIKNCDVNVDLTRDFKPTIVCDAQYLPFKTRVFSQIVCLHLLEHLDQPSKCLTEIARVAQLNATIEIAFPLESNASNFKCLLRVLAYNLWLPALPLALLNILQTLKTARKNPHVILHKWVLTPAYVARYLEVQHIQKVGSYWTPFLTLKKIKLPTPIRLILQNNSPPHSYHITATKTEKN